MTAPVRPSTVVAALDPVAELLLGAVAYGDVPLAIDDGQPDPGLRLRREVTAAGARFVVQHCAGADVVAEEPLTVTSLPLDRGSTTPRPRAHPAPTEVLEVVPARPEVGSGAPHEVVVPATGPTRPTFEAIRTAARTRRLVRIEAPPAGDPLLWGGLVLHLTAAGVVCLLSPAALAGVAGVSDRLRATLPADGTGSLDPEVVAAAGDEDLALARVAAEQRRAALADHDLALVWAPGERGGWAPSLRPRPWPSVSVVLPTRRPALVPTALAMLAAQHGGELEVVVALHGAHDPSPVEDAITAAGLAGTVLPVPATVPFGAVVNAAVARTSGQLVLKWDDDDLYGPHVVEDLVLAQRASGAALTGKAAEFVHLDALGRTIWRTPARAEGPSMTLAGGTFLTPRSVLDEVGGYPPLARAVDHHLKARIAAAGGAVYRTHGFGFVLRRHGAGHTWAAGDERFLAQAVATFEGVPPVLGLGTAARFARVPITDPLPT